MKNDRLISLNAAIDALDLLECTPGEWAPNGLTMCSECDAWNPYKNDPQPEQFNPCTVCQDQELDCIGCKFRRT